MDKKGWPIDASIVGNVAVCEVIPAEPIPPPQKFIRLGTVRQIRGELAAVYRAVRSGQMASGDGTRLTYMLNVLANMTVDSELADRIEALEKAKGP